MAKGLFFKEKNENKFCKYKIDLYTKAYLEEIVKRSVDTVISSAELERYYAENKDNFRTNSTLVRLRYIHLDKDNPRIGSIQSKFFDYKKKDKKWHNGAWSKPPNGSNLP